MPELPEVETLVRALRVKVRKKVVKDVIVKVPQMVNLSVAKFRKAVKGKKILNVSRRAKMIIFKLKGADFLIFHLKMTGQLIYQDQQGKQAGGGHPIKVKRPDLPNKFSHITFTFTDGTKLYFNDIRKFGWIKLVDNQGLESISQEFGIEPLSKAFTFNKFQELLKNKKNWPLKKFLMDQSIISGLGNIYTDESCFLARIRPKKRIISLNLAAQHRLYLSIKKVIKSAITKKGTSANTYVQLNGSLGRFVPYLKVYSRAGERCKRCGSTIKKIKFVGRGTHYCPQCQK